MNQFVGAERENTEPGKTKNQGILVFLPIPGKNINMSTIQRIELGAYYLSCGLIMAFA